MKEGTAKIVSQSTIEMVTDGSCLTGTLEQLEAGVAAKPMPPAALSKVKADALGLLDKVLAAYATKVASGEVGLDGTALANELPPTSGRCPTGLLYGRVQSGKTVAMITFAAAAIDNGFRVIVVLTSDFVKLVEQTADRFAALDGPLIKNSLQSDNWNDDAEHVKKHIGKHGVVFVCTKNSQRLTALVDFLNTIDAANYPALVLDDEADQATLDTTVQARATGRKNAPGQPSVIHRRTVRDEEGQSIRQTLRHHVFVQVTATPYALLLQNTDSDLRPTFTHLLEPGDGYTGGEAFFDVAHVEEGEPPLISVDEDESTQIDEESGGEPPLGLQRALAFFLVAAGSQNVLDPMSRNVGQNFLCHTSQKTTEHAHVAMLIRNYLNRLSDDLETGTADSETMIRLHWGYEELQRTMSDAPTFEAIVERVKKRLPRRDVPIVNSANSPVDFGRQLNFIVGGNILGRGLTIDNLLVTYYLRRAKVSQMDTVLQHARMFGYRRKLMPFTRVFLPDTLGARFHFIHVAEQNLRRQLADTGLARITVERMTDLRPTRLNVLDTRNLSAYEPGGHIYPAKPGLGRRDFDRAADVESAARKVFGGSFREREFVGVALSDLVGLLTHLPFDEDWANMWDPTMLGRLLDRISPRYQGRGFVYYRTMKRRKATLATGALSGDELADARNQPGPVLCVFRDDGRLVKEAKGREFWYPSLVLPGDMPTQVFNTTA
ncbi:MAG: Z1 domain-containing protein [Vicinamibacterales bacterium]